MRDSCCTRIHINNSSSLLCPSVFLIRAFSAYVNIPLIKRSNNATKVTQRETKKKVTYAVPLLDSHCLASITTYYQNQSWQWHAVLPMTSCLTFLFRSRDSEPFKCKQTLLAHTCSFELSRSWYISHDSFVVTAYNKSQSLAACVFGYIESL